MFSSQNTQFFRKNINTKNSIFGLKEMLSDEVNRLYRERSESLSRELYLPQQIFFKIMLSPKIENSEIPIEIKLNLVKIYLENEDVIEHINYYLSHLSLISPQLCTTMADIVPSLLFALLFNKNYCYKHRRTKIANFRKYRDTIIEKCYSAKKGIFHKLNVDIFMENAPIPESILILNSILPRSPIENVINTIFQQLQHKMLSFIPETHYTLVQQLIEEFKPEDFFSDNFLKSNPNPKKDLENRSNLDISKLSSVIYAYSASLTCLNTIGLRLYNISLLFYSNKMIHAGVIRTLGSLLPLGYSFFLHNRSLRFFLWISKEEEITDFTEILTQLHEEGIIKSFNLYPISRIRDSFSIFRDRKYSHFQEDSPKPKPKPKISNCQDFSPKMQFNQRIHPLVFLLIKEPTFSLSLHLYSKDLVGYIYTTLKNNKELRKINRYIRKSQNQNLENYFFKTLNLNPSVIPYLEEEFKNYYEMNAAKKRTFIRDFVLPQVRLIYSQSYTSHILFLLNMSTLRLIFQEFNDSQMSHYGNFMVRNIAKETYVNIAEKEIGIIKRFIFEKSMHLIKEATLYQYHYDAINLLPLLEKINDNRRKEEKDGRKENKKEKKLDDQILHEKEEDKDNGAKIQLIQQNFQSLYELLKNLPNHKSPLRPNITIFMGERPNLTFSSRQMRRIQSEISRREEFLKNMEHAPEPLLYLLHDMFYPTNIRNIQVLDIFKIGKADIQSVMSLESVNSIKQSPLCSHFECPFLHPNYSNMRHIFIIFSEQSFPLNLLYLSQHPIFSELFCAGLINIKYFTSQQNSHAFFHYYLHEDVINNPQSYFNIALQTIRDKISLDIEIHEMNFMEEFFNPNLLFPPPPNEGKRQIYHLHNDFTGNKNRLNNYMTKRQILDLFKQKMEEKDKYILKEKKGNKEKDDMFFINNNLLYYPEIINDEVALYLGLNLTYELLIDITAMSKKEISELRDKIINLTKELPHIIIRNLHSQSRTTMLITLRFKIIRNSFFPTLLQEIERYQGYYYISFSLSATDISHPQFNLKKFLVSNNHP